MTEIVKAKIYNKAVIKCKFSPPGSGSTEIVGQPKILTATYSFVPLTITIKERSDNE